MDMWLVSDSIDVLRTFFYDKKNISQLKPSINKII